MIIKAVLAANQVSSMTGMRPEQPGGRSSEKLTLKIGRWHLREHGWKQIDGESKICIRAPKIDFATGKEK